MEADTEYSTRPLGEIAGSKRLAHMTETTSIVSRNYRPAGL